jgi:hypothetical protein
MANIKNIWSRDSMWKSGASKWEVNKTPAKRTVTLTFIHDANRMMRNSVTCTYAEFEDLLDLVNKLNQPSTE